MTARNQVVVTFTRCPAAGSQAFGNHQGHSMSSWPTNGPPLMVIASNVIERRHSGEPGESD